jgi:hypothetical protein
MGYGKKKDVEKRKKECAVYVLKVNQTQVCADIVHLLWRWVLMSGIAEG